MVDVLNLWLTNQDCRVLLVQSLDKFVVTITSPVRMFPFVKGHIFSFR